VFILRSRKSFRLFWLFLCGALIAAAGVTGVTLSNSFIVVAAGIAALFLIITMLSIFSAGQDELTGMSLLPEWKPNQDTTL
jgi:peptidoglycan/LPS O-acetylase OafA/YrhL